MWVVHIAAHVSWLKWRKSGSEKGTGYEEKWVRIGGW